ncbi:hypothetical protein D3C87_1941300 [compost metagenome]
MESNQLLPDLPFALGALPDPKAAQGELKQDAELQREQIRGILPPPTTHPAPCDEHV